MPRVARGPSAWPREREPRGTLLGRIPQVCFISESVEERKKKSEKKNSHIYKFIIKKMEEY